MSKIAGVTWPRPRPLSGKLFMRPFGIHHTKLRTKFEISSLAQAVFEILRSRCIGVTSLTFQGHVTSSVTWPFDSSYAISYWWSIGTKPLYLTVSEIFNVKCSAMVDVTLIRPLNKGQGHSFWYQSISHIRLLNSKFCSRTHRLATIHNVTDRRQTTDRETQHCSISATVSIRSAKKCIALISAAVLCFLSRVVTE